MAIRGSSPIVPLAVKNDHPAPIETDGTSAKVLAETSESAPLEGIVEPLELVQIDPKNVMDLYTIPGALQPTLDQLAIAVRSIVPDITTAKGRAAVISLAAKIGKAKVYIEDQGVALNRKLKEQPAMVDANKRGYKEFLETLQAEIRQPVTGWEDEQARIEAKRKADEEAAALLRSIESDHEIAIALNRVFDLDRKAEMDRMEREMQEREDEIAREAAEAEKRKAQQEIEAAARREQEAKDAAARSEKEKVEAEQRQKEAEAREAQAKIDAEAARVKAAADAETARIKAQQEADERAEQAAILARQQEQQRQAAAAKAEKDALELRERNQKHRHRIHTEALEDLIKAGIDPEAARAVIGVLRESKVRHLSIAY